MGKSSTLIEMATWASSLSVVNPYLDKSPAIAAAVPAHIKSLNKCRYLPLATSHCHTLSDTELLLLAASCPTLSLSIVLTTWKDRDPWHYGTAEGTGPAGRGLRQANSQYHDCSEWGALTVPWLFISTPWELPCLIPIFIGPQSNIWRNLVTYLVNDWREVIVSESAWSHCLKGSRVPVSVSWGKKKIIRVLYSVWAWSMKQRFIVGLRLVHYLLPLLLFFRSKY